MRVCTSDRYYIIIINVICSVYINTLLYTEAKFVPAIEKYTQAIELTPNSAVLYANRAFANIKIENFGYCITLLSFTASVYMYFIRRAIQDAQKAIELDKTYVKGYYRMATAKLALGKHKEAISYFRQVSGYIQSVKY